MHSGLQTVFHSRFFGLQSLHESLIHLCTAGLACLCNGLLQVVHLPSIKLFRSIFTHGQPFKQRMGNDNTIPVLRGNTGKHTIALGLRLIALGLIFHRQFAINDIAVLIHRKTFEHSWQVLTGQRKNLCIRIQLVKFFAKLFYDIIWNAVHRFFTDSQPPHFHASRLHGESLSCANAMSQQRIHPLHDSPYSTLLMRIHVYSGIHTWEIKTFSVIFSKTLIVKITVIICGQAVSSFLIAPYPFLKLATQLLHFLIGRCGSLTVYSLAVRRQISIYGN